MRKRARREFGKFKNRVWPYKTEELRQEKKPKVSATAKGTGPLVFRLTRGDMISMHWGSTLVLPKILSGSNILLSIPTGVAAHWVRGCEKGDTTYIEPLNCARLIEPRFNQSVYQR